MTFDETDVSAGDKVIGIEDIVFDEDNKERSPWQLCGNDIPRTEVVFFVQVFVITTLVFFASSESRLQLVAKNRLFILHS